MGQFPLSIEDLEAFDLESWREVARVIWTVSPVEADLPFRAYLAVSRVEELILSDAFLPPQIFEHHPSQLPNVNHDVLLYERYLAGTGRGVVGEVSTAIDPSVIHIVDLSQTFRTVTAAVRTHGTIIPHKAVGYDPSRHAPYVSVPVASPRGRLLDIAHEALVAAQAAGKQQSSVLANGFLTLVRTLLLGERSNISDRVAELAGREMIKRFIERNLADPKLNADMICRSLSVSRATLYRLFEETGGVARFITDSRLDRCFSEIVDAQPERGAVRRIAERWAFYSPANFNRSFRARFGLRPSDCIGAAPEHPTADENAAPHRIHLWLRKS